MEKKFLGKKRSGLTTCCPRIICEVLVFLKFSISKTLPHQKLAIYLFWGKTEIGEKYPQSEPNFVIWIFGQFVKF